MRRRRGFHYRLLGRTADHQRRGSRRQQHRDASGDRHSDCACWPRENRQRPEGLGIDAGCGLESLPRQAAKEHLDHVGYLEEYSQYPNGKFGDTVPRGGNAGGSGQPGWVLKCKGWQTDPNAYVYFTIQEQNWGPTAPAVGHPEWVNDPAYSTARARQPHIFDIFAEIEKWLAHQTKFEAVEMLRKAGVPCAPVLSMKEITNDPALRASGSVVEVQEELRGNYLTVGSAIKFSAHSEDHRRSSARGAYRRGAQEAGL
jgi:hypothetical protein